MAEGYINLVFVRVWIAGFVRFQLLNRLRPELEILLKHWTFFVGKADNLKDWNLNQSRICGKGVGLSLFPSDSLSFESYEQFVRKSKKVEK